MHFCRVPIDDLRGFSQISRFLTSFVHRFERFKEAKALQMRSFCWILHGSDKFSDQIPRNLPWLDVKVLIVDGNSTDNTAEEAEKRGAIVHNEPRKGYGRAYKTGFSLVDTDYVATIDGDTTYPADKIPHVLAFLINNNLDLIQS